MKKIHFAARTVLLVTLMLAASAVAAWAAPLLGTGAVTVVAAAPTVTKSTDIPALARQVQNKLMEGWNFVCEEWEGMDEVKQYTTDLSTRSITVPIDLAEDGGVGAMSEGGYQMFPTSPAPDEATLSFIQVDGRYSVSGLTRILEAKNSAALLQSQIAWQGRKKLQAMAAWWSDMLYGDGTGVRALVTGSYSAGTIHTLTLSSGLGNSAITDPGYITRLFKDNRDRVALVRSGSLVTNAWGLVTAKSASAGTISVTWAGTVTPAANDKVVLANAMYDAAPTLTETDYNQVPLGLLGAALNQSVHGINSATQPRWAASLVDQTTGRFTGTQWHKANDLIGNNGGGKASVIRMAQGVYRDFNENYLQSVRFTDPYAVQADGQTSIKGTTMMNTRRVPPGMVWAHDPDAVKRLPNIVGKPSGVPNWDAAEKMPNRDAYSLDLQMITGNVVCNRANIAFWSGRVEQ